MIIKISDILGDDQPVFMNLSKSNREFTDDVIFAMQTGYPSKESLAYAVDALRVADFKINATLNTIGEEEC